MVTGTVEDIKISEHIVEVKVRYDKRHRWGKNLYKDGWAFARLSGDFATLQYLEIIDDNYQTIVIQFKRDIAGLDQMFAQNYSAWGAVNLKEWLYGYESCRFTQFSSDTAIITSEYNMNNLIEWFKEHAIVTEYQYITK